MLSWKLMKATEKACRHVCENEEVANHYQHALPLHARLNLCLEGFITGWLEEEECITLFERCGRIISRWRQKRR